MMVKEELISSLRARAANGDRVPDLLRFLYAQNCWKLEVMQTFQAAFCLELRAIIPIGGWAPDGNGEIDDDRISELVQPAIEKTKSQWLAKR